MLSKEEFGDSLRLGFGLEIDGQPSKCDGCDANITITHALNCKLGGLVNRLHNDLNRTFQHLSGPAFTPSAVSRNPLINSSVDKRKAAEDQVRTIEEELESLEDCGDTGVSAF